MAAPAMVPGGTAARALVACCAEFMIAAVAPVGPAALPLHRCVVQAVVVAAAGIGDPQVGHDCAPFGAVRSGAPVADGGDQMGHLVRDRGGEEIGLVPVCDVEVVAQERSLTLAPLRLPRRLATQVEADYRVREASAARCAERFGLAQDLQCALLYMPGDAFAGVTHFKVINIQQVIACMKNKL